MALNTYSGPAETNREIRASRPFYWYTSPSVYRQAHSGPAGRKEQARRELVLRDLCPGCMQRRGLCVCR